MNKMLSILMCLLLSVSVNGQQRVLSLDSCRSLALRTNKQLKISRNQLLSSEYEHKVARTNYLPKIGIDAAYIWNQKSTHLLSKDTRNKLETMGNTAGAGLAEQAQMLAQQYPQLIPLIESLGGPMTQALNGLGKQIVDAFKTSTYNMYAGSLMLTQPLYLGGRIRAYDKITKYTTELLGAGVDAQTEEIIYSTDQAYWQVVSLVSKKELAEAYVAMLQKLDGDIQKMYSEGVTTKAGTLTVRVKLNEAEMTLTKVTDGLSLARMLLCQLCGLPIHEEVVLCDEGKMELSLPVAELSTDTLAAFSQRSDLKALSQGILIADEGVKIARASQLPSISAFAGYSLTNPNVYNGFKNDWAGNMSLGLALHLPIDLWGASRNRIKTARLQAENQRYLYEDAKEKINLQINQAKFKVEEANKKLVMTERNLEKANENLHYADVGFHEGVIATADLLEAQTAWLQARSERLDAEIDVRMAQLYLQKSMGNLHWK